MNGGAGPEPSSRLPVRRFTDERGTLAVIEADADAGFPLARIYWLSNLDPESPRGFHAHHRTRQIAVCMAGSCRMLLCTPDGAEEWLHLTAGGEGVRIEPMVWHEMHEFSTDCILLVMADRPYNEADYIRDRAVWESVRGA